MKKISLVTAKVVRENEQYNYKLVGKGEKYLVQHNEGENAGEKVMEYLTPYAKEPVIIESVVLQKSYAEIIGEVDSNKSIFRANIEVVVLDKDGQKTQKTAHKYYIFGSSVKDVVAVIEGLGYLDFAISSIARTNIIEVL